MSVEPSPVRLADGDDLANIGLMYTRAFEDDPIWRFLVPSDRAWRNGIAYLMRHATRNHLAGGTVWTTPGVRAAAVWSPPGHHHQQWRDLPAVPRSLRIFGRRSIDGLRFQAAMRKSRPTEPHWYLAILGTDPAHQGHGHGSAVLAPVLERCDREVVGAYLESSKESNIGYYERHGFAVQREERPVAGAPAMFLMWRDPRPQ